MKRMLVVVMCLLAVAGSAAADDKTAVQQLLKDRLDAVFAVLQRQDLAPEAKSRKVVEITTPMFDFPLMARLSLGKKHWPGLSKEQKEKFTRLFVKRLQTSYLGNLTRYTNEKVVFEPAIQVKKKVHVPTFLVSKDKKISMLYKLYKSAGSWKIYDIEIQGVSIIRSYRSQFSQILENSTIDDLMHKLEQPAEQ